MRVGTRRMIMPLLIATFAASAAAMRPASASQEDSAMSQEFMNAVAQGDAAEVKEMLARNPRLARSKDEKGVSAILKATYHRKTDVVRLLLDSGCEIDIFEAAATGQTERARALIERDPALANVFSADGFTPLALAVFFGHRDTVEALLAAGADVNATSRESMKVTPLQSAAAAREVAIARVLIAHGANVNARDGESKFTPLHEAAATGQIDLATLLLDQGADVNARMSDGKTPLGFALERNQTEMAAFLRARGAVQ